MKEHIKKSIKRGLWGWLIGFIISWVVGGIPDLISNFNWINFFLTVLGTIFAGMFAFLVVFFTSLQIEYIKIKAKRKRN